MLDCFQYLKQHFLFKYGKLPSRAKQLQENEFTLSYITDEEISDITTRTYDAGEFPSTLQEKEKIKKIMFVKFRLSSDKPMKMNFYQIAIDYVLAGHYRGE